MWDDVYKKGSIKTDRMSANAIEEGPGDSGGYC